jgi:hypothetical protein
MLTDLFYRLRAVFRRSAVESELSEELSFHFENEVDKYLRQGMSREEALRRAQLAFGGSEQIKEHCRDARGTGFIETSLHDLRYAIRQLGESRIRHCYHPDAGLEYRSQQRHLQRYLERPAQITALS